MRLLAGFVALLCAVHAPVRVRACDRPCKRETARCIDERCAAVHGKARRECRETCRGIGGCATIRTLAWVDTVCRTEPSGLSAIHQTLMVRRGNCAPVAVMDLPAGPPVPDLVFAVYGVSACRLYGDYSVSLASTLAAPFQRLAVSRDARGIVFEVSNEAPLLPNLLTAAPELEGLWYVRSDGTGLRSLGKPSRQQRWILVPSDHGQLFGHNVFVNSEAEFSADNRLLAFSDLGPGPDGELAPQVWVMDLGRGERRQLTRLPSPPDDFRTPPNDYLGGHSLFIRGFVGNDTIVFFNLRHGDYRHVLDPFTVKVTGGDPQPLKLPTVGDGTVDPNFGVIGRRGATYATLGHGDGTGDLFAFWPGGRTLQLTNFHSNDLRFEDVSPNGHRFLIITPEDPPEVGENPSHNCQLFSIDDLAGRLRQVTHFKETEHATSGCNFTLPRSGCSLSTTFWDQVTNEIVTYSNCDPFGANPHGGQLFAMRPDGSRLRQLTTAAGLRIEADGAVVTELPGPFRYSSPGF